MFACQLCFAINDSIVKLSVEEIDNNISTLNVIFIRGLFSTFFIFFYLKVIQKKNSFEIHFPKTFTIIMKILQILPNWIYFRLVELRTRTIKYK